MFETDSLDFRCLSNKKDFGLWCCHKKSNSFLKVDYILLRQIRACTNLLSAFGICHHTWLPAIGVSKNMNYMLFRTHVHTDDITLLKQMCGNYYQSIKLEFIFKYFASKYVCIFKTCNWFVVKMLYNLHFPFHLREIIILEDGCRLQTENL